jgi:hypothetical protein
MPNRPLHWKHLRDVRCHSTGALFLLQPGEEREASLLSFPLNP